MKISLTILFGIVFGLNVQAKDSEIIIATEHQLQSTILNEERSYTVYLPPSYSEDTTKMYPVIYLLDGDSTHLKAIAGQVEALSTERLEQQIQEAIIVAIPNSKNAIRERDFTPTNVDWTFKPRFRS